MTKLSRPGTVVAGLTARRNALEAQVRTLQTDLVEATEIANKAAQLESDNEALKSQLNEARQQNRSDDDLAKRNEQLESDLKMMSAENDNLRYNLQQYPPQYAAM
jgi:cell division protein FtsB